MAARGALAGVLAAATAAILVAGCATAVTGVPRAATTLPTAPDSTTTGTSTSTTAPSPACDPCTPPTTISSASTSSTTSSSLRPMPPLSSTEITSSSRTSTSTSTPSSSSTTTSTTSGDDDPGVIAGIHIASVLADLEATHVAGVDSSADLDSLRSAVDRARSQGLQMSVVSIGKKISNADTSAISSKVFAVLGGTLLVLSPSLVSARTDQLTNSQRHKALKAAADAKGDVKAVTRFIDSALASTGGGGATTTSTQTPTTQSKHTKVGGVDITAVVSALGSDHIAIAKSLDITPSEISGPVKKAWRNGLKLYVVILAKDPTVHVYEVAGAVIDKTGGTAIVVSPKRFSNASKTISSKDLNKAVDAAKGATTYHDLVAEMVDSLLG